MRVTDLYEFVKNSDISLEKHSPDERLRIARYGLFSEIGSVIAALKKADLLDPNLPDALNNSLIRGELKEEIGDALWYAVMLAQVYSLKNDDPRAEDIFTADLRKLMIKLKGTRYQNRRVQQRLGKARVVKFLSKAGTYLKDEPTLDGYQDAAAVTARTSKNELREVCVAVLQQLTAQLAREMLPEVEHALNHEVYPKDPINALGEIVWHLAAIATLYDIKLSDTVILARDKAKFRNIEGSTTDRHDMLFPIMEQFPTDLKFQFRDINDGVSEVSWWNGKKWEPMGNELEDNHVEEDAYRYHDVMHLAFIVFLGWSPVFRKFLGRKRKTDMYGFDESVQDGGRAKVLQER